ncbi:MAG: hypothetical protein HFJ27_05040 [Clostridia bacterium]|nr:hypothetical protein [Clostridia bacterium]
MKIDVSSKLQCKAKEETMSRKPSQKTINRRIQSQIDQAKGNIVQLVEQTSEYEETLVKHEQDINGLKQSISNIIDYKRTQCNKNQLNLMDCQEMELVRFNLCGAKEYDNYLFPHDELYPGEVWPNEEVL